MPTAAVAPPNTTVIVTRPQPQADDWVQQLQALGIQAGALPLLGIDGPPDPASVQQAWHTLAKQALVMFVSPSAVARFFAGKPAGAVWPPLTLAGSTGPGTAQALADARVPRAQVVSPPADAPRFDSEALWTLLAAQDWTGRSALIVRGEGGRDWLADTLRQHGARVHFVEAYRRTAPVPDTAGTALLAAALAAPERHVWLFSSSEAVGHLPGLAPQADWTAARALASHPRIAQAAQALGINQVAVVAPRPDAVADALAHGLPAKPAR